jgi:hypothetical protein
MSREERRAYQRQIKSLEKGPALPPAARARAERKSARRERRTAVAPARPFTARFILRAVLVAAAIGLLGFSFQWGEGMPWALYVGLAAGAVALAVILGVRYLMTRAAGAS